MACEQPLPVIIKEKTSYGVDFHGRLLWVDLADNPQIIKQNNSEQAKAKRVMVLCHHDVITPDTKCSLPSLCLPAKQMSQHFDYLNKKNYLTITMQEMYWYVHGIINLPKRSVCLTFDDGRRLNNLYPLLERYDIHATSFVVGTRYNEKMAAYDYRYLELQSHTYDLHSKGHCSRGSVGGALVCYSYDKILADLKKSRKQLNEPLAFCYPYYEYDDQAIKAVKEAGFLLAFSDRAYRAGNGFVKVGDDPYKLTRYSVYSPCSADQLAQILGEK